MSYIDFKNYQIIIDNSDINNFNKRTKNYLSDNIFNLIERKELNNQKDKINDIDEYFFFKLEKNSRQYPNRYDLVKVNKIKLNHNDIIIIPIDAQKIWNKIEISYINNNILLYKENERKFISLSQYKQEFQRKTLLEFVKIFLKNRGYSDKIKNNHFIIEKSGFELSFPIIQPKLERNIILYKNKNGDNREFNFNNNEIIAFDFDGVFHKSVYYDSSGQGHPKCPSNRLEMCEPFLKIHEIVKEKYKKGYYIAIVTHNSNKNGIKKFLEKNDMLKYIHFIYHVRGDKSEKLKKLNVVEFYDDSDRVLKEIYNFCKSQSNQFCNKIFKVDPINEKIYLFNPKSNQSQPKLKPKPKPQPQSNKLRIFSWNICWEKMSGSKTLGKSCKMDCYKKFGNYFKKCIVNKYDLICFQEASDYDNENKKYNKLIIDNNDVKNNYGIETHSSGKPGQCDAMITLYNKDKFHLLDRFYGDLKNGEGEKKGGRPYLILILRNNLNNDIILLCNVHFPHGNKRQKAEYILHKSFINKYKIFKYNRIIVVGDHNHEYSSKEFTRNISFGNFKFHNNKTKRPYTINQNRKIDLVSDTKSIPEYIKLKMPMAKGNRVSDHHPIHVIVDF